MKTIKQTKPSVRLIDGHAATTSTAIAHFFGKRHDDVLKRIRETMADLPEDFRLRNFAESSYLNEQNKEQPMFTLTRDGFVLLAMGFTGKAALAWKIKYIEAFNKLEERIKRRAVTVATRKLKADQDAERRQLLAAAPDQALEELALARLRAGMFVMYFGEFGDICIFSRSRKCVIAEPEELAGIISDPKSKIGREFLPGIINAAAQRLA